MIAAVTMAAVCLVVFASWLIAYRMGVRQGRMRQAFEDRNEVELAIIAKATAEWSAELWARRTRALLKVVSR